MSKSAIYTANMASQDVAIDGVINPGTVVRRFGPNVALSGNAIQICGQGYYDVDASITVAPTAVGNVTITMYKDGVPVQGATATGSTSTADNPINLSITSMVREFCGCCNSISNLTFVLTGTDSEVSNVSIVVEKL